MKETADAETAGCSKNSDETEATQLIEADPLTAAPTDASTQQIPATAQAEVAPVTPPAVELAAAVGAAETAQGAAPDIARVPAAAETGETPDIATKDAAEADGTTTDQTKPNPDGKSAVTVRTPKAEGVPSSQAVAGHPHDKNNIATDASREPKPEPGEHHAAQSGQADGPAQKPVEAPHPSHLDSPATATAEGGKPAIDAAAPQFMNMLHPAAHIGNPNATAAAAHAGPAASADTPATPVPIAGLAVEIAARAQAGRNRFEIRLDPPELGRIDVRLDVDRGGNVTSRLVVERVETLDLLRRDAGELQRALQDAGLKTGDNGLQFALRDQSFAGRDDGRPAQPMARVIVPDAELGSIDAPQAGYARALRLDGGVDIHV